MLGIDRRAARVTWTVLLIALVLLLAFEARETIMVFTLALFFAYMLSPLVELISRFTPKRVSRNVSLAAVYLMLVGAIVGLGFAIGGTLADQATTLTAKLPELLKSQDPLSGLPFLDFLGPFRERVLEAAKGQLASLDTNAIPILKRAATEILAHVGSVLTAVLIPILAFFFLKDAHEIKEELLNIAKDPANRMLLEDILGDVHIMLGHYIRALITLSAATFISYTLFLQFTGAQYALLLGGFAAVLEFIPVVGPLTAAVAVVLVCGITGYSHIIAVLVFIVLYRMFQDYVLSPYLMGSGVELHPLLVLFGVLAGEQIAGVPGMFFSVPVLAILRVIYQRSSRRDAAADFAP